MKPVLVAATLLLAIVGPAVAVDPVTENWKDDEGDNMVLEVQPDAFSGIYDGGRLTATLQKDGSFAGFWMQDTSEQECADKKDGTAYWGRFSFIFDARRQHFKGVYSYCDAKPAASDTWNGDRIDDAAVQAPNSEAASSSLPPGSSEAPPTSVSAIPVANVSSEPPPAASVSADGSVTAASSSAAPSVPPSGPFTRHHH